MSATVTPERLSPREHDANNPNRSATPGVFSLSEPNTDALRVRNALPAAQAPQARHAPQKPAAPNVATAGHANGNNGDLTIEQVISNVVPPPGAYDGAPNHHQGFTRSLLSKIIGGSPQATWVKPASSKNYPYRLHPSHLYICVKRDLNQWLPKRPGEAGALTVFREDKAIAVHNRIYPLFICHDRNNWVYYGHYRFLHFPTNNGELPLARYNRFSQKQKEEWARHILSKSWGRKMLTKKKITTTEQEAIDVASLINFFESPDNQRHCRLMLRLMEPVRYDSTLYRQLLADSSPNADAGGPARRQRLQDSDEEGSH
ncbi:hypothetical protein FN846DRAFT_956736 [Sphaerosporella brunnea]|uniref:DUF6697 domain-containing protein n=1 Tax=Sphaerosporella brunnea TaxID=1250544 RepID=A0A5J5ERJ3_9PEZI|nr:hypothetical protein FN846DRAFT_956736 [Sphaerosporella brunnea]